jgi:hypothetical protein
MNKLRVMSNIIRLPKSILLGLILTSLSFSSLQAQECDCKSDVEFLVERYKKDYSGFQDFKIESVN